MKRWKTAAMAMATGMACWVPLAAWAGVNPQNGNFYITYKDLESPDGSARLGLVRTYNSHSTDHVGWLGRGWGTLFETRLRVLPEGVAAVREVGSGAVTYYRPAGELEVEASVDRLVAESQRRHEGHEAQALRQALRGSEEARLRATERLGVRTSVAADTVLRGDRCPEAVVRSTGKGFERRNCDRSMDRFDDAGRLLERRHVSGARWSATYQAGSAWPASLNTTSGPPIALSWTAEGRLASAALGANSVAYQYSPQQDLVKVSYSGGMWYGHVYDAAHNLTTIHYLDGTSLRIGYDEMGRVTEEVDRLDQVTSYAYLSDPLQPDKRLTRITHTDSGGKVEVRELAFQRQVTDTGISRLAWVGQSGGEAGQPQSLSMDERGRVVRKVDEAGEQASYVYHPRSGKLIIALRDGDAVTYHYGDTGALTSAQDASGRSIALAYDRQGQIARLTEQTPDGAHREFKLQHDAQGRLQSIALKGVGTARIVYGDRGEIAHITSSGGAEVTQSISRAFFHLLSLVKAAR